MSFEHYVSDLNTNAFHVNQVDMNVNEQTLYFKLFN